VTIQQIASIDRQIKERCTQASQEELQQKTGAEFDKAYIGSAINAHVHAVAALEVIGKQSQGQLAQIVQEGRPFNSTLIMLKNL
jgi:predicted outer membrane protein